MEEKDREIWVGESRYYLGEDNILYETVVGEQDEKTALASKEATDKLHNMVLQISLLMIRFQKNYQIPFDHKNH